MDRLTQALRNRLVVLEWKRARRNLRVGGVGSPESIGSWPHLILAGVLLGEEHFTELVVQTQRHAGKTSFSIAILRKPDDVLEPGQNILRGPWPLTYKPHYASAVDELKRALPELSMGFGPSDPAGESRIYFEVDQNGLAQDAATIEAVVRPMVRCARRFYD